MTTPRDQGSQSIEFALTLPIVVAVAAAVVVLGHIVLAHLGAHQTAVVAARLASVTSDTAVDAALDLPDGVELIIEPRSGERQVGDLVTARIDRQLQLLGQMHTISVTATFVTEDIP